MPELTIDGIDKILDESDTREEAAAKLMLDGTTKSLGAGMCLWDMRDAAKKTHAAADALRAMCADRTHEP